MPIGQDEDIRIYELPEAQELTAGMKVAVDSETDGTKSFDITTAMSEKVEEFVAEYNVTSYEDIDAAYKAGKSVICKYQPYPQGNPEQVYYLRSMQYIPFAGYMFGTITSILGFEFIVCGKNNDTTVWSVSHDNALKTPDSGKANGKILSTNGTNTLWIDPPEGIPSSTAQDEGKVLTVDSNGAAAWENPSIMVVHYSIVPNVGGQLDKTFAEIKAACDAHIPVLLIGPNTGVYSGYIGGEIYTVNGYTATSIVFRSSILPHLQIPGGMMTDNSGVCQITLSDQNTLSYDTILIKAIGTIDKGIGGSVSTSSVDVPNNSYSSITTSQSSLTINIPNGEYGPTNIVVEITPTVNCTVTVTRTDSQSTETLKYSVAAGNTLEAGKYYQVTAVGNCWTLAEFANPS